MRAPWYIAGPLLGLVIVGLRAAMNAPFGVSGGYLNLVDHRGVPQRLGVGAFMLLGIVAGGAVYVNTVAKSPPSLIYDAGGLLRANGPVELALLLLAGFCMGFGARAAGGCTSGHGLTGTSLGSPASFAATATFFATAVVLAHVLAWTL